MTIEPKRQPGFTLIEVLLYVALAGAVSIVLFQAIGLLQGIRARHLVAAEVDGQASWAMQRIGDRLVTGGIVSPPTGSSSDRLTFDDGTTYLINAGSLFETTPTASWRLTSSEVTVSDLSFVNRGAGGSDIMTVSLTVSFSGFASGPSDVQYEQTYGTSITPQ